MNSKSSSAAERQARHRAGMRTELREIRTVLEELDATVRAALAPRMTFIEKDNHHEN